MSAGQVGVLSVGAGDIKLSFDKANPAERIRAARIVKDMLRRGYALLVEDRTKQSADGRPIYTRALEFDEDTCEYILADFDPIEAAAADKEEGDAPAPAEGQQAIEQGEQAPKGKALGRRRVEAGSVKSVAVARTAGG